VLIPMRISNFVFLTLGLAPAGLAAQDSTATSERVSLTAHIVDADDGRPLIGAIVRLAGLPEQWVTDVDGEAMFSVPIGGYVLSAERSGYETLVGDFEVFRPGGFTLRLEAIDFDDPWAPGRLLGTVVDDESGQPLEGVAVSLLPRGRAFTDGRGRFVFDEINPGLTRMTVERLGYTEREEPVSVQPGRTTAVQIRLSVDAIELPPIEVDVRSPHLERYGVYDRMDRGTSGQFITRAQIAARPSSDLSDSFQNVPGLSVVGTGQVKTLYGRGNCLMRIFVDGQEVAVDSDGIVNIDDFPPEWVEMAEVYAGPAATPVQYARAPYDCGVVLMWTRRTGGGR